MIRAAIAADARLPAMVPVLRSCAAAALLLSSLLVAACGSGEPKGDPAGIDATLNSLTARDEAEKANLIAAARAREEVREREMEQNAQNYQATPD
jgi:hypothetical protein